MLCVDYQQSFCFKTDSGWVVAVQHRDQELLKSSLHNASFQETIKLYAMLSCEMIETCVSFVALRRQTS